MREVDRECPTCGGTGRIMRTMKEVGRDRCSRAGGRGGCQKPPVNLVAQKRYWRGELRVSWVRCCEDHTRRDGRIVKPLTQAPFSEEARNDKA